MTIALCEAATPRFTARPEAQIFSGLNHAHAVAIRFQCLQTVIRGCVIDYDHIEINATLIDQGGDALRQIFSGIPVDDYCCYRVGHNKVSADGRRWTQMKG